MNISINTYNRGPCLYKPYDHMLRAGWTNVSIAYQQQEFEALAGDGWMDYIRAIKDELDSRGMRCVQTHLPYYDLLVDCEQSDEAIDRVMDRGVILCAMLGAKWGAFHCRTSYKYACTQKGHDVAYTANLAMLKRMQKIARDYGVGIAIENLPDYVIRTMPGDSSVSLEPPVHLFGTNYHDIIALADELDDPEHIGICWDFGHAHMNHVDQVKALREVGTRLKATHIHSNSGYNDDHLPISLGTINWDDMARVLAEIGYDGSLSLECIWPGDRVAGCSFEQPGFFGQMEQFAEPYFAHNYRLAVILMDKVRKYRGEMGN
ncbi:MAG: sugar phosphate isomerase/epimerase [Clostridia bacterium]|nr:sugar phosphate isomerase/epimerase [Clostridia bacterium]